MIVLKFGGTSVAKPERIQRILDILNGYYENGERFTLVVSAFGGVTDQLLEMSKRAAAADESYRDIFQEFKDRHIDAARTLLVGDELERVLDAQAENHLELENLLYGIFLLREASGRTLDYLLSFGERNAAYLISQYFSSAGLKSDYLDARNIIQTDSGFGSAKVDFEYSNHRIRDYYKSHPAVQVVTGFIASNASGQTTTLGRGGSDYTVSILGAALSASRVEIWTDVDGVLTADPRKVRRAFTIPSLTYEEAMELSHFGAKVIYPPTLLPAMKHSIPVYIRNTFNPDFSGTCISSVFDDSGLPVKGVSSISNIALLTLSGSGLFGVPGIAARLFGALAQSNINVILITQGSSEHSICFAVSPVDADRAREVTELAFEYELQSGRVYPVRVEKDLSVIAVIGENMRYQPGISGRLFDSLGKNGVNAVAIAQGSSERNISVVIQAKDERKGLNALHESFFLSDTKELHVFMVGVGLIGSTLIEQIKRQRDFLLDNQQLEVKIIGLANSRKMVFSEEGIDLKNWKSMLVDGEIMDMPVFIERMKSMNMSNTIFIDNTATEKVSDFYFEILDSSISISTPNKIATSSTYLEYKRLKAVAEKRGVQFLYETNVGAGLPVLSTLKDLILSGDKIISIEGVLSGSLSFIFNSFDGETCFSDIVKLAKERGFTEPDPRDDLGGFDVRRKLVILAREAGYELEPNEVVMPDFLPADVVAAKSVDAFFELLQDHDTHFEQLRKEAASEEKVLRFVGSLNQEGKAEIQLKSVDSSHPFYGLSGSDNMIVFTSLRYKERPLVVRGPGAGASVTAAGVFAEIIQIGNYLS
ncbi:MAG: bifunctional aspartate kinase/homoserine dehydrogenase I [Bacteroidetes bacterium]|nr:bifunctional aspartate kinase/homoserine dehydrogenase I [Bacteroidota bacterium]